MGAEIPEIKIPENLARPKDYDRYFQELINKTREAYKIALLARSRGLDPETKPEISLAYDLASRVEAMVGPRGIGNRIRELQRDGLELEEIAVIIAREIAEGKWTPDEPNIERIAEQAIRTSLAIITNGIVAAPLEGIVKVKIRPEKHLAVYYAGPIRSAGGTETAMSILLADIVRRTLKLKKYEPTEGEVARMVEEVFLYKRYKNLQYPPNREKIIFAMRHLPIEINGEGTDKEVQIYRSVKNVNTPKIRGGAVLVLNDGFIAKSKKLLKIIKRLRIDGWEWLEELSKLGKEETNKDKTSKKKAENPIAPNTSYLSDSVIGRPIFSSPMGRGGFRLRYGRSRNTGLAAVGIHPATMYLLDEFLVTGTQIKPERPGKGAIVVPVDSIACPIVKLGDGSVISVDSVDAAMRIRDHVEKILFLGDMLIAVGEFLENNHKIIPSPIVEEWWLQELMNHIEERLGGNNVDEIVEKCEKDPLFMIELCEKAGIYWHPRYVYFWKNITAGEALRLFRAINQLQDGLIPYDEDIKDILERLLILHELKDGKIILKPEDFLALKKLGEIVLMKTRDVGSLNGMDALTFLRNLGIKIADKYTCFIGARMGRPEKAKIRQMKPPVHVLFPMGEAGKHTRVLTRVLDKSKYFTIEAVGMYCENCKEFTYYYFCPKCGSRTKKMYFCGNKSCGYVSDKRFSKCPKCGSTNVQTYKKYTIDFRKLFKDIEQKYGITPPSEIRCVIGLISKNKVPENLVKGVLRAKYNLFVFRDGTIRFDATDAPLTHFKPQEIGVSIEKLRDLGYLYDIHGKPLKRPDQVLELKVQDIIINEDAADCLVRVANFIDDLLEKVYKIGRYYNVKDKQDLIGHLVIGLAPHTSAGIIGRIIGFTKARCLYAHPYWHAAKRRNCDGDEDAIILLLDALINFSKEYIPQSRGGQMDAPLIVTVILNPLEVDSEVYNMDTCGMLPLEFYRKSLEYPDPNEIEDLIENVDKRLGKPEQYEGVYYTHDTSSISLGPTCTAYVKAKSMEDKIRRQIKLMKKIVAVDFSESISKILEGHILRDIFGNLRSFGSQVFKCVKCKQKIRRLPLNGRCPYCGEPLKPSVYKNMVLKYFPIAQQIVKELDPNDFRAQQFNRFVITDLRVLNPSITGQIEDFFDQPKTSSKPKDKKVVIRKTRVDLSSFF